MDNRRIVPLKFGDDVIYMEVSEVETQKGAKTPYEDEYEDVGANGETLVDAGEKVTGTVRALAASVKQALDGAAPKEWSVEIMLGFKAGSGIPFVVEGEANGSVKVTAKWER